MYAPRQQPQADLERALGRAQIPLVFGEYGVGKTSLVKKHLQAEEAAGRVVHLPSAHGQTFEDLASVCLEHLDFKVERGRRSVSQSNTEGGIDIKVFSGKRGVTTSTESEVAAVVQSPTDKGLIDILRDGEVTIVVDEFHRASDGFRGSVVGLAKAVNTLGYSYPRIVIVGTAHDAHELVQLDPGVDRLVKEIEVPLMERDEALFIVQQGISKLDLHISDFNAENLIEIAARVPSIVHSLSLDASTRCLAEGRDEVDESDISHAVRLYLADHGKRLYVDYMQAIPTYGQKRYRKHVLHAVAAVDGEYATMEEITAYVSNALGEDVPATALSGPLRDLKESHGQPLKDIDRVGVDAGAVRNLSGFRNPMMKFFVRFVANAERAGLVTSDDEGPIALPPGEPGQSSRE